MDPDPGCPKTCGSGSATLKFSYPQIVYRQCFIYPDLDPEKWSTLSETFIISLVLVVKTKIKIESQKYQPLFSHP
jgi:hypothetical protein